jgi:hypothetical protein
LNPLELAILLAIITQEARRGGAAMFSLTDTKKIKKNRRPGEKETSEQRKRW